MPDSFPCSEAAQEKGCEDGEGYRREWGCEHGRGPMNLCVMGTGYVGLVTGACFADLGHRVICADNDGEKIAGLKEGHVPIFEPGLEPMVAANAKAGRLSFTTSIEDGARAADVVFISVGTPARPDGSADLSQVERVTREIAKAVQGYTVIVEKSTVPVNTGEWVKRTLKLHNSDGAEFDVASVPEFLREGSAVEDFMHPDRVVIGVESTRAEDMLRGLFEPFGAPLIFTDIKSAEVIKHASNSFLAMKISYMNAIASICERVGADVTKVAEGMGYDHRIGPAFLNAGLGYGGACFPKDVAAFIKIASDAGYDFELLKAVETINREQRAQLVKKVREVLWVLDGKTIGVLGLSFKPNTDDMRNAPATDVIRMLQAEGATVKAYDPAAMEKAKKALPEVEYCGDPYEVAEGSDALVIVTEWDEFKELDMARIKGLLNIPVVIDGRNMCDPQKMRELGFEYRSVGR